MTQSNGNYLKKTNSLNWYHVYGSSIIDYAQVYDQ